MRPLCKAEAEALAQILLAGVPAIEAVKYFLTEGPIKVEDSELEEAVKEWPQQQEVLEELQRLTGGVPWHKLTKDERIKLALDKIYADMAYYLWSNNYGELNSQEKAKADTCRQALEAKIAGTAGKNTMLDEFYRAMTEKMELEKVGRKKDLLN